LGTGAASRLTSISFPVMPVHPHLPFPAYGKDQNGQANSVHPYISRPTTPNSLNLLSEARKPGIVS
jgi:hypothetical protein